MAVRWNCPNCGAGVNAPTRMRKIDVRRYCLQCSEEAGVLIERTAPALERKRNEAALKRKAKSDRQREAQREAVTVAGVNLERELSRIWRMKLAGGGRNGRRRFTKPTIYVVRHRSVPTSRLGSYWPDRHEIRVNAWPTIDWASVLETLVHEAAHAACAMRGEAHGHERRWSDRYREMAEAAYGIDPGRGPAYGGRLAGKLRDRYSSAEDAIQRRPRDAALS